MQGVEQPWKPKKIQATKRISNAAVQAKTGKVWQEWFELLDAAGAANMSHPEIAWYLSEREGLPGWWSQMVTVGYEQERKAREVHEVPTGYQISVSKTLPVPVSTLYQWWTDDTLRDRWLPNESITLRKATPHKSPRITWSDGHTSVEVNFYDKGASKSQVTVQHSKLPDATKADEMKVYWREALGRLEQSLKT